MPIPTPVVESVNGPRRPEGKGVWLELRQLARQHKRSLTLGILLVLTARVIALVTPWMSKVLIDDIIGRHRPYLLLPLAGVAASMALVQLATSFALSRIVNITAQRAITDLRKRVLNHVLQLPVSFFDSTQTGVLISRVMTDAEGMHNLIGAGFIDLLGSLVTATVAFTILLWLNAKLTLALLTVTLAFAGLMVAEFKILRPMFYGRSSINAYITGRLAETVSGIRLVKVYVAERREQLVFARGVHDLFRSTARTITGASVARAGSTLTVGTIGVLMITIGGRSVLQGTMTMGDFIMYVFLVGFMAIPLVEIAAIGPQISEAFAGLDRIRGVMRIAAEDASDTTKKAVKDIDGMIEFRNVTFEYNPGIEVLRHISFTTPARSTTALVGASGSGKSTLVSLVMALNHPQQGCILVDGQDMATLRVHDYRRHIAAVMQDAFLFDATIRENIAYGAPGAADEAVRRAGRIAHVDEFAVDLAQGYDTIVGERGVKLSGGQRQRLAIARAILADPRILILDEATTHLDAESEAMVRDGLCSLRRGRTTFIIAHRLSTIESADQILVLESGQILEHGAHAQLLALGGRYRAIYERQCGVEHHCSTA